MESNFCSWHSTYQNRTIFVITYWACKLHLTTGEEYQSKIHRNKSSMMSQESNNEAFFRGICEFRLAYKACQMSFAAHRYQIGLQQHTTCRTCRAINRECEKMIKSLADLTVGVCEKCPICHDEFNHDTVAFTCPCFHAFHQECLMEWKRNNNSCPYCRTGIFSFRLELYYKIRRGLRCYYIHSIYFWWNQWWRENIEK